MSTVFLHVGQCGNQVGHAFWKKVDKDHIVKESRSFVQSDDKQRSIHVDSEPKVLRKISKGLKIREGNIVCGKRGRGTNWALGYYGNQREQHLLEDSLERVRMEVEKCDNYGGCIMMHSLSGGTGSGLGSRLCEEMRDQYPLAHLMSCAFTPLLSGESPLQHYNSLLTLSKLQRNSDCVILIHNDDVLQNLEKKAKGSVSFDNMNNSIAASLCGLLLPTDSLTPNRGVSIGMEPWELIRSTCPMPGHKFLHVNHLSRSKVTWEAMMSQLLLGVRRYNTQGGTLGSLSNVVVARGDSGKTFLYTMKSLEKKVKAVYNCVSWNPFPLDVWTATANPGGLKDASSITIASNHGTIVDYLETLIQRSKVMYDATAYIHWYKRYGSGEDDFEAAFETMREVVDDYKDALK
ncbi:tubulin delta chain-like [Ylistrum balloti]|uniref:tubulin delta chain-like n=1 Tax=Ylistrum balloti TaxID=509963 RepID=UPI0029058675|nr:tubulin delta chain-like [Ylistrum balloti]